jgi:hypothetical protein
MAPGPLSARQRSLIARIASYQWTSLTRLGINPRDTALLSLRKRGLVAIRHTKVLVEPQGYDIHEVCLVAPVYPTDNLSAAVQNLIDAMAPVVRKLLAKQITEVNRYLVKEEPKR